MRKRNTTNDLAGEVLRPVVEQHAEESALLWLRRDWAVGQPHYALADLAKLDGQLDAHLDGLRIAGEAGWDIAEHELRWEEAGEVFTAAVLAFESGRQERIERALSTATGSYELSRAVISALGWLPIEQVARHIDRFLAAQSPTLRRIGIAASAVHRTDPGPALMAALADAHDLLRARALRAVGELGRIDLLAVVREHLGEKVAGCRLAAAWTAALLAADAGAVEALRGAVESGTPSAARALQLAVRRGEIADAEQWIVRLAARPATLRSAVVGTGALGSARLVPWLMEMMQSSEWARLAGEAFTTIAGVDLAWEGLEAKAPVGFLAGPTEDPEDENVAMDPDENLPWPDREKVAAWWERHRHQFEHGARYLLGKTITLEWLQEVLRNGRQRQRAAAALELAIRQPGQPLFEVRATGFRQQRLLGLK